MIFKQFLKKIIPQFILNIFYKYKYQVTTYTGSYQNWKNAIENSKGWNDNKILKKIIKSTNFCLENNGHYERDGEILSDNKYPTKIVEFLNEVTKEDEQILDYGGSLGSLYYQIRSKINLKNLTWIIFEQKSFFEASKDIKKNKEIYFIDNFYKLHNFNPSIIIFSSVLQYLENPLKALNEIKINDKNLDNAVKYIIIDRIILSDADKDQIYVQKNPLKHLNSSYPIRFFSKELFLKSFFPDYRLNYIDKSYLGKDFILNGNKLGYYTIILSNK